MSTTLFAKHKVDDYGNWKRVYDDLAAIRKEKGVTGASVHRDANEPDVITVTHRFNDLNAATAFADSEELRTAMANAGVQGPPDIWFTEDVEETSY